MSALAKDLSDNGCVAAVLSDKALVTLQLHSAVNLNCTLNNIDDPVLLINVSRLEFVLLDHLECRTNNNKSS